MEFLKIWEILLRRKWTIISVFFVFIATVVIGTHIVTPSYEVKAKLLVEESDTLSSLLSALGLKSSGKNDEDTTTKIDTETEMAQLRPLLEELISSLKLKKRNGKPMNPEVLVKWSLINKVFPQPYLDVDQCEDANMIEIVSTSSNPVEAVNMSNRLAENYIKNRVQITKEEYKAAGMLIEDKIKKVQEEYFKSLNDRKDFQIKNKTIDLSLETQNLLSKIMTLKTNSEDNERTILELEKSMAITEKKFKEINMLRKESEEYIQSEQVNSLKTKLNDLLTSIAEKSIDFTKEHPEYKQLEKKVETVKDIIRDEMKVVFNSERLAVEPVFDYLNQKLVEGYINKEVAIAKRKLLSRYIEAYQKELLNIPVNYVGTSKIESELTVNQDMYQKLLVYLTQASVAEAVALSNIKLVERAAVPDEPDFPKKTLNYILGIFLGLFWGLALAFFMEYIDNTIKSPEDVKDIKSMNLLGTIPKAKQLADMNTISNLDPTSPIVEAYRTIRNSIRYTSVDKPFKTLIITSSIDGEGKSSITSNIAINLSMEDKKVILVDLDLRRPDLHKFFQTPNSKGVTNVLAEGLQLKEAIIQTNLKGLDLLPSGPVPSDPSRLIGSEKVRDTIDTLKKMYDTIIIDTPSVMTVNDAIVIGAAADGVVYVIEPGKTTFSMVEHVQELIAKAGLNLIGVVLNKFRIHGHRYYYYNRCYKK